jgi:hypothetical protein
MMSNQDDEVDRAVMGPACQHGYAPIVRYRNGTVRDVGFIMPAREGVPVPAGAELVNLRRREDGAYDCTTLVKGPPQVSTPAYREGWDSIFGKREVAQA